ncbi:DUF2863 family protein [Duganella sp. LX20W]|uniref:DUF2863 family protein n=1 Tax=Rugamonas brunnea TaxID=2758569 RepID=A0A7W2EVY0_9BURK|nr:DUF2863 family protein [Rugamonas brunnea]MBA5639608.1 DUF2863 family protein [Rugamonas brunnea]
MPKNKRPVPRKPADTPEHKDELLTRNLCELALELAEQEDPDTMSELLRQRETTFHKLVRKLLNQHKDEVLYGAVELAKYEDVGAYHYLRDAIEEAAGTVLLRRDNAPELEIDAFAIPVFVHSTGGLEAAHEFQDPEAYDALLASFKQAELESPKAKVVLIGHAYDLGEIDRITYSALHEMVRDAATSMMEKKLVPTPAIERSLAGWTATSFGPDDAAVELRFLVGFALKRADDPFYRVPSDEAAADAYFARRMERYQRWTEQYGPLVRRCLAGVRPVELNFLYQDLFFGAKQQGVAEHDMLQMLATLNQALAARGADAAQATAIVGPADVDHEMQLRTCLYLDGAQLAAYDKPLDLGADLETEVADVRDALASIGLRQLSVAMKFGPDGVPVAPQAL